RAYATVNNGSLRDGRRDYTFAIRSQRFAPGRSPPCRAHLSSGHGRSRAHDRRLRRPELRLDPHGSRHPAMSSAKTSEVESKLAGSSHETSEVRSTLADSSKRNLPR